MSQRKLIVEYTVIHAEGSRGLLSDAFQKIIKDHHDFINEEKPDIDEIGEVVTENGSFSWKVENDNKLSND